MAETPHNRHPDAQISHSVEEVAARVVKHIRALKPDAVLTFDPIGGYRHPDHIHIHLATVMAFERSDDPSFAPESGEPFAPRALYFHVIPRRLLKSMIGVMRLFGQDPTRYGRNRNIDLTALVAVDFPIHVRLDVRPVSRIKDAARRCHASQGGGAQMRGGIRGVLTAVFGDGEGYMRAYPPVCAGARPTRDLLDLPEPAAAHRG